MRMLSKIYLSLWIALAVVMTAVMVNVFTALWSSVRPPSPRSVSVDVLRSCADTASNKYEHGGAEPLRQFLSERSGCPDAILVDIGHGAPRDVSDESLSRRDSAFVEQVRSIRETTIQLLPWRNMIAVPVSTERSSYVYVATVWAIGNSFPIRAGLQLFTVGLISGVFCYLLTLYFGRPLTRLGRTAEKLGAGDLSARIDDALTKRRDEVGDLAQSFNRMAGKIETLVSDYKNFLAHVSHELGSPLTRVNMALGLARRKAPASLEPELDRIADETERLNTLVQELLLLARLESGNELDRHTSSFNIGILIEEACADVNFEAELAGKSIVVRRSEDFGVNGYRELLRRSLDNILRNGLRFSREGGSVYVDVYRDREKNLGIISIQDDGPGIEPEQQRLIFEPFVSLPNRATGLTEGSGLGLAISRQAILAHKGRIHARNSDQGGLIVTIELPIADASQPIVSMPSNNLITL